MALIVVDMILMMMEIMMMIMILVLETQHFAQSVFAKVCKISKIHVVESLEKIAIGTIPI